MGGRSSVQKGKRAERAVAAIWRANGWQRAAPSPGSGGLRPYGPRDVSPWPGDLIGVRPWLVEVKHNRQASAPSRGWPGESFVRRVLLDLTKLYYRHADIVGAEKPLPCLFARGDHEPWSVYIPDWMFRQVTGMGGDHLPGRWVRLDVDSFFRDVVFGQQMRIEDEAPAG